METLPFVVAAAVALALGFLFLTATRRISKLTRSLSRLAKYSKVADADEAAARILREAQEEAERAIKDAAERQQQAVEAGAALKKAALGEAEAIRRDARTKAAKDLADAEARVADADARARAVIAEADRKAEAIAGDALRAVREASELERTVRALQNVVEGYGDKYIIPTHTVLDDLAEGFAHTEAGQKLKLVRERIRDAVRLGKAATCDYVEENRRTTAIRFVTDAFNGKADTILAQVRQDNVGTLQQQLRDAATLVNHNGEAFRNARVTDEYLGLRLEELNWAVIVNELKDQEREEQRRIKEQLREEERARKEYERAIRDAAKQEELLKKAMNKARVELSRATDEQKAKYEAQLQELQQRLTEAEQKNQRALSMAQQTKRGHVYIISNLGSFGEHVYKIGLTRRLDPQDRIRELGDSSVPFEFDVHALLFAENAPGLEAQLHRHFVLKQVNKVNHRKEFFRVTLEEIRTELESLGLSASWTMAAAARHYRETLAIEKAIADDPTAREAWVKRQLLLEPEDAPVDSESENEAA